VMKERTPSALVTVMRVLMGSMRARSLEIDHDIRGDEFVVVVPCYMDSVKCFIHGLCG
jgi:hypothetical protein